MAYFYRMLKIQNSKNLIKHYFWDEYGVKVEDEMHWVKQVAQDFYKKLLGSNGILFDEKGKRSG